MTDDEMDARLRAAAARWQAANTTAVDVSGPVPHSFDIAPAPSRRVRRRAILAVAASILVVVGIAAGLVAVFAGSGGNQGNRAVTSGPSGPEGRWVLNGTGTTGAAVDVVKHVVFEFKADGTFVGNDGCNTMSGPVRVTSSTLTFGDIATTAMGCVGVDPAQARETELIHQVVAGRVQWSITGGGALVLSKPGVGDLSFGAAASTVLTDPNQLLHVTWELSSIESADTSSGSSDMSAITLVFNGGPGFEVTYRCVTETGQVIAGNGTMMFKTLAEKNAIPCSSAMSEMDSQVRQLLTGQLTWELADDQLTITRQGAGALVFTRGPAPATSASSVPTS